MTYSIDWTHDGEYLEGTVMRFGSRREAAEKETFSSVKKLGDGKYRFHRLPGKWHNLQVCKVDGKIEADCDCYDFQTYGAGFARACVHIWHVYLTQDIGVC